MWKEAQVLLPRAYGYGQRVRLSLDDAEAAATQALPITTLEGGGRKRNRSAFSLRTGVASVCGSAWTTPRRLLRKPYLLPGLGRDENGEGVSLVTTYGAGQRVRHSLDDVNRRLLRKLYLLPCQQPALQ